LKLLLLFGKELQYEQELESQPRNGAKEYIEDVKLPLTNDQVLVKEYFEEGEGSEMKKVLDVEGIDNAQDEEKGSNEELDLEEELELKEENQSEKEPEVEEEKTQELDQTIYKEQDVKGDQSEEYIKTKDNKERLEVQEGQEGKIKKISTEKMSSNLNNNSGPEELSTQSIRQS